MESTEPMTEYLNILSERLLRLTSDSRFAHRASGLRGSIINALSRSEQGDVDPGFVTHLVNRALEILSAAAQEIPEPVSPFSLPESMKE